MKRRPSAAIAVRAVLLVLTVGLSSCTSSKTTAPAHECDNLAAHPGDNGRWAKGVADGDIVPAPAIEQCSKAVNDYPKVARFRFQLGRALLAGDQVDDAQKSFETAVKMGYCPAKYYLAERALDEASSANDEGKAKLAKQLLEEASACKFGPARDRLEALTFRAEDYASPQIMEALWEGRIDELNDARLPVALYCRGIQDYVSLEFHPVSQACPGDLAEPIANDLDKAAAGDRTAETPLDRPLDDFLRKFDPVWQGDQERYKNYFVSLGVRDATVMVQKHGCQGFVTRHLYGQVVNFARAKRPLAQYKDKLQPKAKELFGDALNGAPER